MKVKEFRELANLFRESADILEQMADVFEDESLTETEVEEKTAILFGKYALTCAKIQKYSV